MKHGKHSEGKKAVQTGVSRAKVNSSSSGAKPSRKMSYADKPTKTSKGPYAPT